MAKGVQCKHLPDLAVLEAVEAFSQRFARPPDEALATYPPKVVMAKMGRFFADGWLDYGVSLRTAWLTDAGRAELDRLRAAARPG
jgi:hypothetical protein